MPEITQRELIDYTAATLQGARDQLTAAREAYTAYAKQTDEIIARYKARVAELEAERDTLSEMVDLLTSRGSVIP